MIEKMKFLSITGPKADIDRVVNDYLSKYEIHLENAMAQLTQVQHLSPYIQINPYRDLLAKVNEFAGLWGTHRIFPFRISPWRKYSLCWIPWGKGSPNCAGNVKTLLPSVTLLPRISAGCLRFPPCRRT